ncbi:MAG: hypothetical protein HKM02_12360 [Pseudomonadales bacterium]|nr:hypothetical protein [Pseudomonadales bacterium]
MTTLLPPKTLSTTHHASKGTALSASKSTASSQAAAGSAASTGSGDFSAVIQQVVSDLKSAPALSSPQGVGTAGTDRGGTNLPLPQPESQNNPVLEPSKSKLMSLKAAGIESTAPSLKAGGSVVQQPVVVVQQPVVVVQQPVAHEPSQVDTSMLLPMPEQPSHVAITTNHQSTGQDKSLKANKKAEGSTSNTPGAGWIPPSVMPLPAAPLAVSTGSLPPASSSHGHSANGKQNLAAQVDAAQQSGASVAVASIAKAASLVPVTKPLASDHQSATASSDSMVVGLGSSQAPVTNALVHNVQATDVHVQTPVLDSQFSSALGQHLLILAGQQVQTARLHVSPPELGPIAVEIRMQSHNQVSVSMMVSHASTHEVLAQSMGALHDSFAAQGMQLQTSLSGGQGQGQGQQAPTRDEWLHSTQAPSGSTMDSAKITPLAHAASSLNSQSLLDLYA